MKKTTFYSIAVAVLLAAGTFLRATNLGGRSLWLDEAAVANFATRPDLIRALADPHVAMPAPLFVVALHGLTLGLGRSEWVLRLLPFLSGTASLFLIYWIGRGLFDRLTALIALFLLAFNPFCIYYSKELKQYSTEMFLGLLLIYAAIRLVSEEGRGKYLLFFSLVSLVGSLASYTFIFFYPPVALGIILSSRRVPRRGLLLLSIAAIGLFAAVYLSYSRHSSTGWLKDFWKPHYVYLYNLKGFLHWNGKKFDGLARTFFNGSAFPLSRRLFAIGIFTLSLLGLSDVVRKRKMPYFLYLVGPPFLLYGACVFGQYPIADRLVLFVAALPMLTVAHGTAGLIRLTARWRPAQVLILGTVVLTIYPFARKAVDRNVFDLLRKEELRPVLEEVRRRYRPDDAVYVYYAGWPAFQFYWPHGRDTWHLGEEHNHRIYKYEREVADFLEGNPEQRAWFIFSRYNRRMRKHDIIIGAARKRRELKQVFTDVDAAAYLFETGQAPRAAPSPSPPLPARIGPGP